MFGHCARKKAVLQGKLLSIPSCSHFGPVPFARKITQFPFLGRKSQPPQQSAMGYFKESLLLLMDVFWELMLASIPESLTMYPGLKIQSKTTKLPLQEFWTIWHSLYPCPTSQATLGFNRLLGFHPAFLSHFCTTEKVTCSYLYCDYMRQSSDFPCQWRWQTQFPLDS